MTSWIYHYKLLALNLLLVISISSAIADNNPLKVTTSADPESNAAQSFIYVTPGAYIPEGIKKDSNPQFLALQIPFVIELTEAPHDEAHIQWQISVLDNIYGEIEVLSAYDLNKIRQNTKSLWLSEKLVANIDDHLRIVFRPKPPNHKPGVYKKGRGPNGSRRKYGGGTEQIDDDIFNPRLGYEVTVNIIQSDEVINTYSTTIAMDRKDMIRQEYINHYGIQRYGYGENGDLPVPKRSELSDIPNTMHSLMGNPLTESEYGIMVNDGLLELAQQIANIFNEQKALFSSSGFVDLNKNNLSIPNSKLWISSGWRNPERNEWYSNAVNGIHQRGGAIDFIIYEPPGDIKSAIAYWVLWTGLENNKEKLNAYWQLEVNGRPMRTEEFTDDIEPKNGIPDAFDKADHLHVNILYETQ
ncbi:MAG TPA: hypothetical protein VIQ03_15595 [Gammaproteobacteria bacterium]